MVDGRRVDRVDDSGLTDTDRVSLWLMGDTGRAAIESTCRALRLPLAFDADLERLVLHAADQMTAKGESIDSVPAWTRKVLRLRALDLVKAPACRRRARDVTPHRADDDSIAGLADSADDIGDALAEHDAAAVRRQLLTMPAQPWQASAALTVLTVLFDGAEPGARCPRPAGGASPTEAARWVGLWYAGRHDLFPSDDVPAGNTLTKRRSRASAEVKAALASAATVLLGGDDA